MDVKSDSFAEYNEESKEKDPKFKANDHFRITKYENIFAKGYAPNWSEESFVVKKIKNTLLGFMKKNCKKPTKKNSVLKK